jgi:hypothetical protein
MSRGYFDGEAAEDRDLALPAGVFQAWTVTVVPEDGVQTVWYVEEAPPHRLLGWQREDGEAGWMTGSLRTAYWQQHREGDEALRVALGLAAR